MICTWFGVSWPGSCAAMAVSVLAEDSGTNRGEMSKGAAAVRFAAVELANMFLKMGDGLRAHCKNWPVVEPCFPARGQKRGDLEADHWSGALPGSKIPRPRRTVRGPSYGLSFFHCEP